MCSTTTVSSGEPVVIPFYQVESPEMRILKRFQASLINTPYREIAEALDRAINEETQE